MTAYNLISVRLIIIIIDSEKLKLKFKIWTKHLAINLAITCKKIFDKSAIKYESKSQIISLAISFQQTCNENSVINLKKLAHKQDLKFEI